MDLSTAVAAWLLASAPLPGQDMAAEQAKLATLLVHPDADLDQATTGGAGSATSTPPQTDDIVVSGRTRPPPEDPIQALNIQTYAATQAIDTAIVAPAAIGYQRAIPSPIRTAVRNFFTHITLPVVFLNDLLQLKPGRAAATAARFLINSTLGLAGTLDIAKLPGVGIPYRRNGLANTLGYYGIKTGPFLYLPLIGPTTIRDLVGLLVDRALVPTIVGKPFNQPAFAVASSLVGSIDYRAQYDAQLRQLQSEVNPYAAARSNYLKGRQAEIDALHSSVAPVVANDPAKVDGSPRRR